MIGYYLGTPILVTLDYDNGWIEGVFPDREKPGRAHKRQKPFTYTGRGPDAWRGRFWRDQVTFPLALEGRSSSDDQKRVAASCPEATAE